MSCTCASSGSTWRHWCPLPSAHWRCTTCAATSSSCMWPVSFCVRCHWVTPGCPSRPSMGSSSTSTHWTTTGCPRLLCAGPQHVLGFAAVAQADIQDPVTLGSVQSLPFSRLAVFQPSSASHVADRVLVLRLGVRPEPLRWESRVQDIGSAETSWPQLISIGESSPRDLHLNTKTQRHSTTIKLQCWTPYAKQLATQEHNPTH